MLRLLPGVAAAALVIVFAIFFLMPLHAFAADCQGQMVRVSWYGLESCSRGNPCKTATGRYFNGKQLIVAHKTLRFGSRVRFTFRGRSIILPVEDRGPYVRGRSYDLSEAAARVLGTKSAGVALVCAEVLR